jgi:RNA polymerase sigma factor (sigma-70 family)
VTLEQFYTYQEQTFDSFCKAVIRNESIDALRELAHRREHEVEFSALSANEMAKLRMEDDFDAYRKPFRVHGYVVEVCDRSLGEILEYIPSAQRDIVLLSYFLDYSDLEISKLLNMSKSTVHYRRNATLRRLRQLLEDLDHG